MWFWNFSFAFVLYFLNFSYGYNNITNNFANIALPNRFIESVENYIKINENKISQKCILYLNEYMKGLKTSKLWAWQMFDAGTKIPSGILSGNLVDLGQFDQCLKIINKETSLGTITGKYCLGSIPLPLPQSSMLQKTFQTPETRIVNPAEVMASMFATCLPDSCSTNDVQNLYSGIIKIEFFDVLCQSKFSQPKFTTGDIVSITFFSIIFSIMLISTTYDTFLFYMNKKPLHSLLIAFSALSNGRKLFATTKNSTQISCLSGIRVISMMWIILAHRFSVNSSLPNRNFVDILKWMNDKKNMYIMGATVSVDTFFVLGGLLVSYTFMAAMAKGTKFNIFTFYIHRYLRLTPLLAAIIIFYVTLLKYLGSGPLWHSSVALLSKGCEDYWWSALLYVQNYVNPANLCLAQSWYLSVDTQLFILSPILLISLKRWPKLGIFLTAILLFASILASFLIAWFDELRGFMYANIGENFLYHYYYATHTRAGPWLIGILLGYFIYEIKLNHKKVPMNNILALILWIIALGILCACVYTGHNTKEPTYIYDRVANSFYVALLRPGWAFGISWVIIACVTGHGGPVNWFLSLPMFQITGKLTYSMYLIHVAMQTIVSSQVRTSFSFSNLDTFYTFWGDFSFTFATSILFTLTFESPIIIIEKVIFGTGKGKSTRTMPSLENKNKIEIP